MGLFAALMTYLVVATLLVGGMVTGFTLLFSQPSDASLAQKQRPPLVRAAERQAAEALKAPVAPQSASASPTISAVNRMPANPPQLKAAEQAKPLAGQPARKKKVAKPVPAPPPTREGDTTSLGYGPEQRKFIFPLDPGW